MPGFSTTTSCPRTGRTAGSGTSSRAPRPGGADLDDRAEETAARWA
ncbi:hypothetical protein SVIOM342S_09086 [Streptomyces violaceorubidus]